jgi:ribonuclease HIII
MKARLHNRVLLNLIKKHGVKNVYVDKFVSETRIFPMRPAIRNRS